MLAFNRFKMVIVSVIGFAITYFVMTMVYFNPSEILTSTIRFLAGWHLASLVLFFGVWKKYLFGANKIVTSQELQILILLYASIAIGYTALGYGYLFIGLAGLTTYVIASYLYGPLFYWFIDTITEEKRKELESES